MREPRYLPLVSLVVPFHNDGEAVERFFDIVIPLMTSIDTIRFEIVCVNDGSRDDTFERLVRIGAAERRVRVIDLTRRFGKEAALTAGLDEARGDAVIALDADLPDPPALIPVMIEHWRDGAEVVAAKRSSRACDSFAKRTAAAIDYRVHNLLSDAQLPENVGAFRLMDRKVVNALRNLPERHCFMNGPFAWIGYRTVIVEYRRDARSAGRSTFSGRQLRNVALEGIARFGTAPLRSWAYVAIGIAALALLVGVFIALCTWLSGNPPVLGYAAPIPVPLFVGGIGLIGIGAVGEYVRRVHDTSKQRPVYLIRRRYQAHDKVIELPVALDARDRNARHRAQPGRARSGAR
ncbi:glycosyltransferase family 2 protein [Burkholderia metallica]|uniref:glycosyltransferase family 2 protein n=1 Tax=Burkholderia metallica TaxID=488729 RepID=UPI000D19BC05|nr:glycosyltransferase family 2 protein [Burkholderia metallica]